MTFTLLIGDVRDALAQLPDESVNCVVTSPPYWGLRDYGTVGQLGLEPTPDEYVRTMTAVFRDVRRVLHSDGTLWLNMGDSYATQAGKGANVPQTKWPANSYPENAPHRGKRIERGAGRWGFGNNSAPGLKPKDLCGIPWQLAFALRADGWYLRSEIIWAKPNPMPESCRDRPTKAHETIFLLSKKPRYFFDQEAVREPTKADSLARYKRGSRYDDPEIAKSVPYKATRPRGHTGGRQARQYDAENFKTTDERNTRFQGPDPADSKRNIRTVWTVTPKPFKGAHFATFPPKLVEPCVLAGCPEWVCTTCGEPRKRIVKRMEPMGSWHSHDDDLARGNRKEGAFSTEMAGDSFYENYKPAETTGWTDCGHGTYTAGVVLDPFLGSGTTAIVALQHGRDAVGIELNPEYAEMARKRVEKEAATQLNLEA